METKKTDQELFSFVEFDHAQAERTGYSEYSYWKSVLRTFAKNIGSSPHRKSGK